MCPGTPGAIWLATVWMTRLAVGMVANAMVGFSSRPEEKGCQNPIRPMGRPLSSCSAGRLFVGERTVVLKH